MSSLIVFVLAYSLVLKLGNCFESFDYLFDEALEKGKEILITTNNEKPEVSYNDGFWSYEVDSNSDVWQIHKGNRLKNDNEIKYLIGTINNFDDTKIKYDYTNEIRGQYFLEKGFDNGEICELTGEPRHLNLLFYCQETNKNQNLIDSMVEFKKCSYNLKVSVPQLCSLKLFNNRKELPFENVLNEEYSKILDSEGVTEPVNTNSNLMHILSNYKPNFIGNSFYYLESKKGDALINDRLLYTGDTKNLQINLKKTIENKKFATQKYHNSFFNITIINNRNEIIESSNKFNLNSSISTDGFVDKLPTNNLFRFKRKEVW